jgi:hypothetical protein
MTMKRKTGIFSCFIVLAMLCTLSAGAAQAADSGSVVDTVNADTTIAPYNGPIGPDNPLYGLKIAFENLDESFTTNETDRVTKEMDHAQLRLSEVRRELDSNRSLTAQQALDRYWEKLNLTNQTISPFGPNATGLLHAQEMIAKHQVILANLLLSHPNNTGLLRAYNNSLALELRFENKTEQHLERLMTKNNQTILKAIRMESRRDSRENYRNLTANETGNAAQDFPDRDRKSAGTVTPVPTLSSGESAQAGQSATHGKPSDSVTTQQDQGSPGSHGNSNHNGNSGGNSYKK